MPRIISDKDYIRLMRMLQTFESGGGIQPVKQSVRGAFPLGSNKLRLAIAQENAQTDGTLSVKLMNRSGAAIGDAFDIYIFNDKAETDYTTYILALTGATIATDNKLWIKKGIDGCWYLDDVLIKITTVKVIGNFASGDALDLTGGLRATECNLTVFAKTGTTEVVQLTTTTSCP